MLLYVTGSYPDNKEGIASGAKVLIDAMVDVIGREKILLLTTDMPIITDRIKDNSLTEYKLLPNWRVTKENIKAIYAILDNYPISAVHMEYPGDLYGKTFLASFLPGIIRRYNKKKGKTITVNVRLHEFTRARFLRKLAILPILWDATRVYVPAQKDRETVSRLARAKVLTTIIGTNIKVVSSELVNNEKITISYFGSVYPGKGIEHMLLIWKKIREMDTAGRFLFKVIGEIDTDEDNHFKEYHRQVWKWIEQYELKDCIEVTGYVSDEEVSHEIQNSQIATLFYEDGLTLRRGSFLAYLAHGIPVVTSMGDEEAYELFNNHSGIAMTENDNQIIQAIMTYVDLTRDVKEKIRQDNLKLSEIFNWNNIASTFMKDYEIE